ncbi:MAG: hypothetical protein Q9183_004160 [Haloplaca sp. 2 TL-2023]
MSSLPPEIRLQVFTHCSSIASASNLAKTCKAYYSTWSHFTSPICASTLPRDIHHYDQALTLAQLQLNSRGVLGTDADQLPRMMVSNAKAVQRAKTTMMQDTYWYPYPRWPSLAPSEKSRFTFAYYCVWILATTIQNGSERLTDVFVRDLEQRYFASLSNQDLNMVLQVGTAWVFDHESNCSQLTSRESPNINIAGRQLCLGLSECTDPSACPWEAAVWILRRMAKWRIEAETPSQKAVKRKGMMVVLDEFQDPSNTTSTDSTFMRVVGFGTRWLDEQLRPGRSGASRVGN